MFVGRNSHSGFLTVAAAMNHFRCLLAAIFAILIASPLCCCAGTMVRVEKQAASPSCCSDGAKKEKREAACDCAAKSPRIAENDHALPGAPIFSIPAPILHAPVVDETIAAAPAVIAFSEWIDTGPQRARLALLQSFLI